MCGRGACNSRDQQGRRTDFPGSNDAPRRPQGLGVATDVSALRIGDLSLDQTSLAPVDPSPYGQPSLPLGPDCWPNVIKRAFVLRRRDSGGGASPQAMHRDTRWLVRRRPRRLSGNGATDRTRGLPDHPSPSFEQLHEVQPEGRDHPIKIPRTPANRVGRLLQSTTGGGTKSPGRYPNMGDRGRLWKTVQTGEIGLTTRRTTACSVGEVDIASFNRKADGVSSRSQCLP
jgi:hypothetical protein